MNAMTLNLLSIALWGSVVALIVLAVRPFVKKNSNRFMCILWAMVMFRFLCPFAIKAPVLNYYSDNTVENNIVENSSGENSGAENDTATMNMADMKNSIEDKFAVKTGSTIEGLSEVKELSAIDGLATIKPQVSTEGQSTMNAYSSMENQASTRSQSSPENQVATRAQSSMDVPSASKAQSVMEEWIDTQRTSDTKNVAGVRERMSAEDVTGIQAMTGTQNATSTPNATGKQDISDTVGTKQRAAKGTAFSFITEHKQAWSQWIQSTAGHRLLSIFGVIWLLGTIIIFACGTVKYLFIKRKLNEAIRIGVFDKYCVRTSDISGVPMAFGIFKPGIYVPVSFRKSGNVRNNPFMERQKELILWHEAMHLKHRDPLWLVISFLMFALHWWNPLVWISARCIHKDIEMACDEAVLKQIGQEAKGEYAKTLYDFATERDTFTVFAAFGETDAESRIKNTLRYKKASVWVTAVTLFFVLGLCGCLALKPTAALDVEQAELEDEKTSLDGNQDDLESQKTDSLNGPLDELSAENGDAKEPMGPLWVPGGEDYITSYPWKGREASLRLYSYDEEFGSGYFFELIKDGCRIGNGVFYPDDHIVSIDEIGYADINFDHMEDIIFIYTSDKGRGVRIVESWDGMMWWNTLYFYPQDMFWFSENVTDLIKEDEISVASVKNLIFGKDYDGTFHNWQEAYTVVVNIEWLHDFSGECNLIYFNKDDIPDLVVKSSIFKMYAYEEGQIKLIDCSELCSDCSYSLYFIEHQEKLVHVGHNLDYNFYGVDKDYIVRAEEGDIHDYDKADLKKVFDDKISYRDLLFQLGVIGEHEFIADHITMVEKYYESDLREYTKAYIETIDKLEEQYPNEKLKYDLIYLNDDRIPDLVAQSSEGWINIYIYEDGCTYHPLYMEYWDHDYKCLTREGLIYASYKSDEEFVNLPCIYLLNSSNRVDILSATYEAELEGKENPEWDRYNTFFNETIDKVSWYYNDHFISTEEVVEMCNIHPYSPAVEIAGKISAKEIKKQLSERQEIIDKMFLVAEDSLYEKFKNNNEKLYFDRHVDNHFIYGPFLDISKGYTLSELIDAMWLHYSEKYDQSAYSADLKVDFAYIDCGQDGIPEMALEIRNIGISALNDGSTVVYVIKELDGKLHCTYGYETWGRNLVVLNEAGILAHYGNGGAFSTDYDISMFDKDANIHTIYSADQEEKWSIKDNFYMYRYDAQMGEDSYACYVTNDPNYSNKKILMDVIRGNNWDGGYRFEDNMRYPKEFAKLREETLEKYGCTKELLEAEPVFDVRAEWLADSKDIMHRALGEGLNWN